MRVVRVLISPWGALGLTLLALAIGFVWAALDQADAKFLSLVWIFGILAGVLGLGAIAAFIAAWTKGGDTPEPVTPEQQRRRNALQEWHNKIDQWAFDKDNPLSKAQPDDLRRKAARRLTLDVLEQQEAEGKREVLLTLYERNLVKRYPYPIVDLSHADFTGAYLEETNLQGASLKNVNLKDANLSGAQLGQRPEDASEMDKAVGVIRVLAGAKTLEACDLRDAEMSGAILKDAVLVKCKLTGASFEGADFRKADLRAADLRKVRNLTQKQVNKAYGSYEQEEMPDTQLPEHLQEPASWSKPIHEQKRERGDL